MLVIKQALSEEQFSHVRELFNEYADYLGFNLNFQNFKEELNTLAEIYAPPEGCVLLAFYKEGLAGCVGLRKFRDDICEMKRLYVSPKYRAKKIGKILSKSIIKKAKEIGYKYMRLDTLPFMKEAISLYSAFGFKEIDSYRYNPFENAKFYELKL
jgi:GNAT superfamily N-acetyltransferase